MPNLTPLWDPVLPGRIFQRRKRFWWRDQPTDEARPTKWKDSNEPALEHGDVDLVTTGLTKKKIHPTPHKRGVCLWLDEFDAMIRWIQNPAALLVRYCQVLILWFSNALSTPSISLAFALQDVLLYHAMVCHHSTLAGGFNPASDWIISPKFGVKLSLHHINHIIECNMI